MHYYQFNIADYRKDTVHLSPIEHYIYRTLIDWYYLDELPITKETQVVMRRLSLDSSLEQNVLNVLKDFFTETEKGWEHKRIRMEIKDYHEMVEKNQINGKLGGRPKKTQAVSSGLPSETQNNPSVTLTNNHKPLTINQEPSKKTLARGSRLPPDWKLPLEWGNWALQEKQGCTAEDVRKCAERFKDYWISVAGSKAVKVDWQATWRTWVRRDTEIGRRESKGINGKVLEAERILGKSTFKTLEMRDVTEND